MADQNSATELIGLLKNSPVPIRSCQLIKPSSVLNPTSNEIDGTSSLPNTNNDPSPISIDSLPILNPKISRKSRQKRMALWLVPFGFIAGLTFAGMTGLNTFSKFGLGQIGEPMLGGLLGMASGWLGSYVASASVNSGNNDDVRMLRKRNEAGQWLLYLETPIDTDLPWQILQEANTMEVMRLSDL